MQLQELKRLVEFNAGGVLVATSYPDGWALVISKGGKESDNYELEVARGGTRKFKTLDALAKLVKKELYGVMFHVH
tara:strand:- start:182 stop:409 length:228 start_codon:yes stop_codon:yes gene_type:complete